MNWSPPIRITHLETQKGEIAVVRDDLLNGGTKQRAIIPFLNEKKRLGFHEFVYASPFSGYAQIALAVSCKAVKANCTVFVESQSGKPSDFTQKIKDLASIVLTDTLLEAEGAAEEYCRSDSVMKIPLGFDDQDYLRHLKLVLKTEWSNICKQLNNVKRIWLPVGSGTLAKTFREVVPNEVQLVCVDVRVLNSKDKRIRAVSELPNTQLLRVPELFAQPCTKLPSIPSNRYYDSKLWQFIDEMSVNGDVWWNVAA